MTTYLIGWILGNVALFFVVFCVGAISLGWERQRQKYEARRREEARAEGERLKVIAIEDFRRREQMQLHRGGGA